MGRVVWCLTNVVTGLLFMVAPIIGCAIGAFFTEVDTTALHIMDETAFVYNWTVEDEMLLGAMQTLHYTVSYTAALFAVTLFPQSALQTCSDARLVTNSTTLAAWRHTWYAFNSANPSA